MTIPNIILLLESEVELKLFPLIILSIMEQNIFIIDGEGRLPLILFCTRAFKNIFAKSWITMKMCIKDT